MAIVWAIAIQHDARDRLRTNIRFIVFLEAALVSVAVIGFFAIPDTFSYVIPRPGFIFESTMGAPFSAVKRAFCKRCFDCGLFAGDVLPDGASAFTDWMDIPILDRYHRRDSGERTSGRCDLDGRRHGAALAPPSAPLLVAPCTGISVGHSDLRRCDLVCICSEPSSEYRDTVRSRRVLGSGDRIMVCPPAHRLRLRRWWTLSSRWCPLATTRPQIYIVDIWKPSSDWESSVLFLWRWQFGGW